MIDNKKIALNTIALYIRMIVIMAINFYVARIVLDVLGVTDYGIYNLVGTIVVIFTFLKSSLSEATQRFINYTIGKGHQGNLRNVFSTCLNCYILLIIVVIIIGELLWLFLGTSLNIPKNRFEAASFTYQITLFSFAISVMQVPYNAAIVANEKMGVFAKISIIEALLKLFLVVIITTIAYDKLKTYSVLMMINAFVIFCMYFIYCQMNFIYTKYIIVFDKSLFRQILSFSGWNMFGSLSGVLSESGVNLIFNTFCGVIINASIGLSNQINGALSGFITGFQTAFKPQIVKSYAAKQLQDFHKLICRSSKFSFYLFFLISIPIITNMNYILQLWLVDVPEYACIFSQIILIGSLIDATSGVFYSSIGATGKIRNYQIFITCNFILHIVITWFLLYLGCKYEYVFFSRLLTRGLLNFLVGLYFLKKLTGLQFVYYIKYTLLPLIKSSIIPVIILLLIIYLLDNDSLIKVFINVLVFEFISLIMIFICGLSYSEKNKVLNYIRNRKKQ